MTSLLRIMFPNYEIPSTFENAGIRPAQADPIDFEEFDRDLMERFAELERRRAEEAANDLSEDGSDRLM